MALFKYTIEESEASLGSMRLGTACEKVTALVAAAASGILVKSLKFFINFVFCT